MIFKPNQIVQGFACEESWTSTQADEYWNLSKSIALRIFCRLDPNGNGLRFQVSHQHLAAVCCRELKNTTRRIVSMGCDPKALRSNEYDLRDHTRLALRTSRNLLAEEAKQYSTCPL